MTQFGPSGIARTLFAVSRDPGNVAERLEQAIEEAGATNLRQLARELDPERPDVMRRNLYRWLAGTLPGREHAIRLARHFGKPDDYFRTLALAGPRLDPQSLAERVAALEAELAHIRRVLEAAGEHPPASPSETRP